MSWTRSIASSRSSGAGAAWSSTSTPVAASSRCRSVAAAPTASRTPPSAPSRTRSSQRSTGSLAPRPSPAAAAGPPRAATAPARTPRSSAPRSHSPRVLAVLGLSLLLERQLGLVPGGLHGRVQRLLDALTVLHTHVAVRLDAVVEVRLVGDCDEWRVAEAVG